MRCEPKGEQPAATSPPRAERGLNGSERRDNVCMNCLELLLAQPKYGPIHVGPQVSLNRTGRHRHLRLTHLPMHGACPQQGDFGVDMGRLNLSVGKLRLWARFFAS